MPDTGAPWNIPYVTSTDLVSDWPADSLALANAIDAGLDAAGNAGIGSNVVSVSKTDTFTTSSTTYVDVTNMSVTITPTAATSKVLIMVSAHVGNTTGANSSNFQLLRDSTPISIGDAAGSRTRGTMGWTPEQNYEGVSLTFHYLDSPNTTSATTYKLQVQANGGVATVGRNGSDPDAASQLRAATNLTVIEVSA